MSEAMLTMEAGVAPEKLFDVIVDFGSYPEFLTELGLVESKVLRQTETEAEIESKVKKMGFTDHYTLRYRFDRPKRISWSLIKGKLSKENKGSWDLEELDGGRTKATYRIEASFGWMVPKALVKKGIESELPKLLEAFKRRAESQTG